VNSDGRGGISRYGLGHQNGSGAKCGAAPSRRATLDVAQDPEDRLFSNFHIKRDTTFGDRRAVQVTTSEIKAYISARQSERAANATINRELAALKRMYSLAMKDERLYRRPHIPMLKEDNVRQGFFEREQLEAVRRHLPDYAKPIVTFGYITGWRIRSEVLPLQWRQVDLKTETVRLEPGTTKTREGRTFIITPELRACLEGQRTATDTLQRQTGQIVPWVFHREGRPLQGFRRAWKSACRAAGVPGRIPHDLRRTAVRNLERAGVSRSVAMRMVGHKTQAVYERYAIVDEAMMREGAAKLAAAEIR
jgi:integrase